MAEFMLKPAGSVGETEYVSGAAPLPPTTGVNEVAAWFWVSDFDATACVAVTLDDGVTWFDGEDAGPVPAEFVAVTVKVYAVPFARPGTVIGDPVPVAVNPPGDDVTV